MPCGKKARLKPVLSHTFSLKQGAIYDDCNGCPMVGPLLDNAACAPLFVLTIRSGEFAMSSQPAPPLTSCQCIILGLWLSIILTPAAVLSQELVPTQIQNPGTTGLNEPVQVPAGTTIPQVEIRPGQFIENAPAVETPTLGRSRIQSDFPTELILPPPSDAAQQKVSRFAVCAQLS